TRDDLPYGVALTFRRPDTVLTAFGLQDHDILLSFNGIPFKTADDYREVLEGMRNTPDWSLEVERQGQPVQLRHTFKE
ncbi:MAG: hypothetical protein AB1758_26080, partial [Candidatus Eremiobacterota bacterium]